MKYPAMLFLALAAGSLSAQVTYDRILHPDREPQNWLTYSGSYAGHRYSPLTQINRDNVKNLQMKWVYHPIYLKTGNNQSKMENTPLVVDGIMYTGTALRSGGAGRRYGPPVLEVSRPLDPKAYYNAYEVNKGMAIAGRHAVLGDGRLPSAGHRYQDRPRDLGQGDGGVAEGLPVQRGAAGGAATW